MVKKFDELTYVFPEKIRKVLLGLPFEIKKDVNEIRIRLNKPLVLNLKNTSVFVDISSTIISQINSNVLILNKNDIIETFNKMCNYSIYSYQNEIINGFITLKGGHRIGICGTAVFNNEKLNNIKNISSINIRISKEILNFNMDIYNLIKLNFIGILIVGSPGSGKTTLLKNLAKIYSTKKEKILTQVCVIDERGELSGSYLGEAQNDLGYSDILNGYKKSDGISQAIRSLSPDIIVCDEILENDISSIKYGVNSGVKFIATIHAKTPDELLRKPYINDLIKLRAFDKFVFLSDKNSPSTIREILSLEELLKKEQLVC